MATMSADGNYAQITAALASLWKLAVIMAKVPARRLLRVLKPLPIKTILRIPRPFCAGVNFSRYLGNMVTQKVNRYWTKLAISNTFVL